MAYTNGPTITTSGLVLALDAANNKSFRGEPTTNLAYHQNPRIDASYESFMPGAGTGDITANHPGAIRVYNIDNSDISYYLNTGISIANSGIDWEFTRHAYWIYDDILKKPVVQMYDTNNVWKAKYFNLNSGIWATNGWGVGTQYTISWLQWTSDVSKGAHVGMYTRNSSNVDNFWDGITSAYNTTAYIWERVSLTYTVTSAWDQTKNNNTIYMYGMYGPAGILKIADVQFEIRSTPTAFSSTQTRGTTVATGGGWIDLSKTGFQGELINGPRYNSDNLGSVVFDGVNDYIAVNNPQNLNAGTAGFSVELWVNIASAASVNCVGVEARGTNLHGFLCVSYYTNGQMGLLLNGTNDGDQNVYTTTTTPMQKGVWTQQVFVVDRSTQQIVFYHNGIQTGNAVNITDTGTINPGSSYRYWIGGDLGGFPMNGKIAVVRHYNKTLTASEVQNNFNTTRTRFGV
jgi:hypothetical protein